MQQTRKFEIFADYFQFVLMDESSEDDLGEAWTDQAFERMLAVGKTSICPGTLRNVTVPVEIHVYESDPQVQISGHNHAVEASLHLPTGQLVVMGCTDFLPEAPRIELSPGTYQVLYLAHGVDTIVHESDPADDCYIVHLWPGPEREPALLEHWRTSA